MTLETVEVKNGIIFRSSENEIFLGLYDNGRITIFNNISDFDGIYTEFPLEKVALVEVTLGDNDTIWIKDLMAYEIGKNNSGGFEHKSMEDMLETLKFPSNETDDMFGSMIVDAGKAH